MCEICEGINPGLSNVANARQLGVSESTIRRHKAHYKEVTDPFFTDVPVEYITSRGRSIRTEDGSWEKITYNPAKMALREALSYDDLAHEFDKGLPKVSLEGLSRTHAAVLNVADLQIGKGNQRGGATEDTIRRAQEAVARFIEHVSATRPATIVVADNGDLIENLFNVKTQLVTNDKYLTEQIRLARRLMAWILRQVAPYAPEVVYVAVPSNHGQARSDYKTPAGTVNDDFGLEVSYQIEDILEGRPEYAHIRFVRPESLYETAVLDVAGTRLAFNHGHRASGGGDGHHKWWQGQDHGRMPGWDADILVVAHYHNLRVEQSGNGRWIIQCSSGETSSDWFTDTKGESSLRGLTGFDVGNGQWFNLRIY